MTADLPGESFAKGNDPDRAIVTAALTGAITTREHCPAIPYTPEEIAAEAERVEDAGAAVVHVHARTDDGEPTEDPERFRAIHDAIADRTDLITNFATGSDERDTTTRARYLREVGPEVGALSMGSVNSAKYSDRRGEFVYETVFENSVGEIRELLAAMREGGVKPELECFDASHVTDAAPLLKSEELPTPIHASLIMGGPAGGRATAGELVHTVRQLPGSATWGVIGVGRDQWPMVAVAAAMGGNVRVGLEDNFYTPDGEMVESNAELVAQAVGIVESVGRSAASPDEARSILGLR
jgi:uncharacterized protein (DUF849 family)